MDRRQGEIKTRVYEERNKLIDLHRQSQRPKDGQDKDA